MKVFFCAHDVVEYDGLYYYSNPISYMTSRYSGSTDVLTCYAPIIKTQSPESERINGENIKFIDSPSIKSPSHFLHLRSYYKDLRNLLDQNDIAIIHIHVSLINSLCVLAAINTKIPFLTVVVGCAWDALWNHSVRGKFMAPLCWFLEKWCQKKSKYSIYVTEKFLQSRYPTKGKSISCSNVELNSQNPPKRVLHDKRIINLATIAAVDVKYKGQHYVIEALSKLNNNKEINNFKYHIVGGGDDSFLREYADKLGVGHLIEFHGPLPHDQIYNFLDNIDIYIQPSKQEGLPRSVIEAMSRGCLCMGSNIAGIPELIDPQYLFKAGDSDKIADMLNHISIENIMEQGNLNIKKSQKYSKANLDKKRSEFINLFKSEARI